MFGLILDLFVFRIVVDVLNFCLLDQHHALDVFSICLILPVICFIIVDVFFLDHCRNLHSQSHLFLNWLIHLSFHIFNVLLGLWGSNWYFFLYCLHVSRNRSLNFGDVLLPYIQRVARISCDIDPLDHLDIKARLLGLELDHLP